MSVDKMEQTVKIYGRLVSRDVEHIGLSVEIAVVLAIHERKAASGIFTVLQRLDVRDTASMAPK